ncbi:MAG TPA: endo-1,4-beta-xylanase [Leptolyngbyaceae cyanobacterium]
MTNNRVIKGRRAFLLGLGTLAGIGSVTIAGRLRNSNYLTQALDDEHRDFSITGNATLSQRAAAKGLIYGGCAGYRVLSSDSEYANLFAKECAILVPEVEFKWRNLHPKPNVFDFEKSDWLAEFAQSHGMLLRGTALVWHNALPKWFTREVNKQNAEQILIDHITKVAGRYAGRIHSWDVINEVIHLPHKRSDGLRKSPWLNLLGPDYIDIAFHAAAKADPQALLVHNENRLEDVPNVEKRRTAVLKLLERMKSKGTPIHALGLQGHLFRLGTETNFEPKKLQAFIRNVASLGLKILITEMDVTDETLPTDITVRDRVVAKAYEDYLSVVLNEPATICVITWGLSDRYTWLSKNRPRKDGTPVRPLPLDTNLRPKLAWNAVARAFDKTYKR